MRAGKKRELSQRRHWRVRQKVTGTLERPRMSVCFTNKNIHVQFIDDVAGATLAAASTASKGVPDKLAANATSAKTIGALISKYKGTFLLSTPTFCANYTRKCSKEEFASLRFVLAGAEKLRESVATAFHEKFGTELLEGYGCTELAPVA